MSALIRADITKETVHAESHSYEVDVDIPEVEARVGVVALPADGGGGADLDGYALLSGAEFTGPVGIGAESPAATLGPDLGTGTGLTQTVTTVVGRTYTAGGVGVQHIHLDGDVHDLNGSYDGHVGWASFVATATSHTLTANQGTNLEVHEVTLMSVPPLLTVGGAIEVRRRGGSTGIGDNALSSLTHGENNVAVGKDAQRSAVNLERSVAVGRYSQGVLRSGWGNTAVGDQSQSALKTGWGNTAVGSHSQGRLVDGSDNVALGADSQGVLEHGMGNVSVGRSSGYMHSRGDYNVFLGTDTGTDAGLSEVSGSVAIGCDQSGNGARVTESNQIVIGTPGHTVHIPGQGIVINSPNGHKWQITVSDTGVLSATEVP